MPPCSCWFDDYVLAQDADIFRYERYARDYHDLDRARREYAALTRNGTSCVGCGDCLPTCSQEIDIAAKLKDVHRLLG